MKPRAFAYACPESLDEAVALLAGADGDAKIIAGGQSLVPMLAFRLAAPDLIVDLKKLPELCGIEVTCAGIRFGARVRWCDIEDDPRLAQAQPLLAEAVKHVAHAAIRNRGTMGGSVAHADPAAELPGIMVTCGGRIHCAGPEGTRVIEGEDFFLGSLETALEPDEIITHLELPAWKAERRWAFLEFSRRHGDFALAGVALFYDEAADGTVTDAHIGAIGVADRPIRLPAAEAALNGRAVSEAVIDAVAAAACAEIEPPTDIHAPAEYRRALLGTLVKRALLQSAGAQR